MLFTIAADANKPCKSKLISLRAVVDWREEGQGAAKAGQTLSEGKGPAVPVFRPGGRRWPVCHSPHQKAPQAVIKGSLAGGGGALLKKMKRGYLTEFQKLLGQF